MRPRSTRLPAAVFEYRVFLSKRRSFPSKLILDHRCSVAGLAVLFAEIGAQFFPKRKSLCRPEQRLPSPPSMMQRSDNETSLTRCFKERPMYGEIKKFRRDLGVGVIYAEDGRAYRFEQTAIRNRREDLEGHEVHFELGGLKARDIIVLAGSPWAAFGGIGL
jgi:hypothetical protein